MPEKAIHAQEDRAAARWKAERVAAELKDKRTDAAGLRQKGIDDTFYYYSFPREHCPLPTNTIVSNGSYEMCDAERVPQPRSPRRSPLDALA